MSIAVIVKNHVMDSRFEHLTAIQLRTIIIHEMRKFAWALELGSTLSDLEEIRTHIRSLVETLSIKENEEMKYVEKVPQLNSITDPSS
jgi:hypothetical protein